MFKREARKHIQENRQAYLNFGLKFNIVGESNEAEKKEKKGPKRLQSAKRFRVKDSKNWFLRRTQGNQRKIMKPRVTASQETGD